MGVAKVSRQQAEIIGLNVHGDEELHSGDEPPIEEVGEGSPSPGCVEDTEGGRKGIGNAAHGGGVICGLGGFRDP